MPSYHPYLHPHHHIITIFILSSPSSSLFSPYSSSSLSSLSSSSSSLSPFLTILLFSLFYYYHYYHCYCDFFCKKKKKMKANKYHDFTAQKISIISSSKRHVLPLSFYILHIKVNFKYRNIPRHTVEVTSLCLSLRRPPSPLLPFSFIL